MPKVTYHAPAGDSEVVTTGGVRFFDGRAEELDAGEHAALLSKLATNPHFEVDGASAEPSGPADPNALSAVHNGGGRWIIVRGGDKAQKVKDGLNKADAEAFNALSDEDKAAYVA